RALADFIDTLPTPRDTWTGPTDTRSERDERLTKAIESARDDSPADVAARSETLANAWATDPQIRIYLDDVAKRIAPAHRREYLDLLAALPAGHVLWRRYGDAVLAHLASLLDRWRSRPEIAEWSKVVLPRIIEDRFSELAPSEYAADKSLGLVLD